ncbi:ABC transporter ATP-binding protein/permease [Geodermatophilus sp. YIM 151500]|uniref:ABC transporter ATP-binding protein n=1 Tax=Geodermatophilus sp. YIM 151500 TaxID=2984531 RepID=UPI0021E3A5A8|nr:ABC transporter ATP-binding protein [Geodermatophilus sp. YIM 151500]MCV2491801.1 ABC transporter ATP-binding protein/permease [Geodermatophilus sp. YIM 151500]
MSALRSATAGVPSDTRAPERPSAPPRVGLSDYRRGLALLRRFHGGRRPFVLGALLLLVEAGAAVLEPIPIAYLIDYLQGSSPALRDLGWPDLGLSDRTGTLLLLVLGIVLLAAVNSAADSLAEVSLARGGRVLGYNVRVALYSQLQRLSLAYHDKRRTGDVLTRVTGDVLVVEDFVVKSLSNLVGSFLVLIGTVVVLLWREWTVALIAVVVIPTLAFVSDYFSRRIKAVSKTQRAREGELASTTQEMLTSIRLVQSYGRGGVDLRRFSEQTDQSMRAAVGVSRVQATFSFVIALLEALAISAIVWIGVLLVDRDAISVGTLVFFILVLQNMFKPSRKIVSEWYKIGKVLASVDRIDDLLQLEPAVVDAPDARPAPAFTGQLAFRDVTFAYHAEPGDDAPPVLRDVSFEIRPGEIVALVGRSGAGKSTIAQLVPRLYDPDAGAVLADGADLRGFTLESLRSQVSLVLQDTVLLSGSIAENIGYGVDGATPGEIEDAARCANAHDFIESLPDGYGTEIGERGATLSGGQRQRIAIARAFIRRAPVLVLDEPTTGLDADSTRLVVGALRTLMHGTTTIIISHDPDLVRCANRVLVVDGGGIVEEGTPAELQHAGGLYADLMQRWSVGSAGAHEATEDGTAGGTAGGPTVGAILARLRAEGRRPAAGRRTRERTPHPDGAVPQRIDGTGDGPDREGVAAATGSSPDGSAAANGARRDGAAVNGQRRDGAEAPSRVEATARRSPREAVPAADGGPPR